MNKCKSCNQVVFDTELVVVEDLVKKLQPGDRLPSGGCPLCGGYCFPEGKDFSEEWAEKLRDGLNGVAKNLQVVRDLMIEVDAPTATFAMGGLLAQSFRMFKEVLSMEMGLVLIDEPVLEALRAQAQAQVPAEMGLPVSDVPSPGSMDA